MRYILIALILFTSFSYGRVHAQDTPPATLDNLRYSPEEVLGGDAARLYVVVKNTDDRDLTGSVRFFDNGKLIGTKNFSVVGNKSIELWTDWKPPFGEHTLSAELEKVQAHAIGEDSLTIPLTSTSVEKILYVDRDTDADGIGNTEDADDDNDGISDIQEIESGTDPLIKNKVTSQTPTTDSEAEAVVNDARVSEPEESTPATGLEQFLPEENAATEIVSTVTETINTTKTSLDTYRKEREREREISQGTAPSPATLSQAETSPSGSATITRSMLPKESSMMDTAIAVAMSLWWAIYTLVLALASFILGFPALVELVLLLVILITVYSFARRLGRRPFN